MWGRPGIAAARSVKPSVFERIDTYRSDLVAVAPSCEQGRDRHPCLATPVRRREILQIGDQDVGGARQHRGVRCGVCARAEEPSAAQVRVAQGHGAA